MSEYIKNKLIKDCKTIAAKLMEEYGEFFPFALGVIREDETFVDVMPDDEGGDEIPKSTDILKELEETFEELHPEYDFIAVCICLDVIVTDDDTNEQTDCIEIRLDMINGGSTNVYVPYTITKNKVSYKPQYEEGASFRFFSKYDISESIDLETEVFTQKSILSRLSNIHLVVHDIEGNWQFLNGEDALVEDLEMVSLTQILNYDENLKSTLTLPKGWEAHRKDITTDWEFTVSNLPDTQ